MNVTLQHLAACKKLMRVEVEPEKVDETFESITKDFQREAALPGFRPGKAPKDMVLRKYAKDIEDEVKRKLISDSYRKAVEEQKLDVLGAPDIEEIQFTRGQPLQFAATIETAPEFELPEYKQLPIKREMRSVTDQDIERALDALRQPQTSFATAERPVQTGDIVVVNYSGTLDGKPITEIAPTAQGLTEKKGFWIDVPSNSFIPGFAEQLVGAKAGDKRTVNVDFPADFVTPQLAGKKGVYEVEVVEVKEKKLPALDEAFAKSYGAESLEKLKEGVKRDLDNELKYKQKRNVQNQLVRSLLNRVNFELPETAVARETKNVVYDLVQENAKRGVSREAIEQEKDKIYSAAAQVGTERVKVAFLLQKIAEKEDIKISQEEIAQRIGQLAAMYQIPAEKFAKDLQKRNGLIEIYDQIMNEKVMEFLEKNAQIEEVPPAPDSGVNPS
ncbi:MAG TPA: trigger factor [Candidatus Dormibacteraeota bacterium]|nr:trigger factor [Candidatus Dormibacteraeota bacterium]